MASPTGLPTKDETLLATRNLSNKSPDAEFKEFEPRLKYGWFHLKSYLLFQDLSQRSTETGFW